MSGPGAPKQLVSAARFIVLCPGWSEGLGFSELAGFNSMVESQEYSYNGLLGNTHTKQFGRVRPPQIALRRALDMAGFAQMFAWHALARMNNPIGSKVPASFMIMDKSGTPQVSCTLENAWCSKLELEPAKAGDSTVVMMKVTIECDSILMI